MADHSNDRNTGASVAFQCGIGPMIASVRDKSITEYAGRTAGRLYSSLEQGSTLHAGLANAAISVAKSNHVHSSPSVTWNVPRCCGATPSSLRSLARARMSASDACASALHDVGLPR